MRIHLLSVLVDDQAKAERFYTEVLDFVIKHNIPLGAARWLTVVSPEEPDGPELLLEPAGHPAAKVYQAALFNDGIPLASFDVDDLRAEYDHLVSHGVRFKMPPTETGPVMIAVFDDTCGNYIQLVQNLA